MSFDQTFEWLSQSWYCGTTVERCRYCLRPVLFAPACIMDACTCGSVVPEMNPPIRVKPATRKGRSSKISVNHAAA